MFDALFGFLSEDIAIDLGTANTLIHVKGRGIVVNEPSVVALRTNPDGTNEVVAIGKKAKEMLGKTHPGIRAIRPMKDGVIADFDVVAIMIQYFIKKIHKGGFLVKPRIVICVPYGVTDVERRAVREAARASGAREIYLIEEPMAAAIGSGLPIDEPIGNMVVDIGGGTTEIAIISLYGIVLSRSLRVGGDKMDEDIINYIKRKHSLSIGEITAEQIKVTLGDAIIPQKDEDHKMVIKGNDLVAGVPRTLTVSSSDVSVALKPTVDSIVEGIKVTLEKAPPELAADILERGIALTGGGSLLRSLDVVISNATQIPVFRTEDPFLSVVRGTGRVLDEPTLLKKVTIK